MSTETIHANDTAPAESAPTNPAAPARETSEISNQKSEIAGERESDPGARLVPVAESIRYRKRAQAAEQLVTELRGRIDTLGTELEATRRAITQAQQRSEVEAALAGAGAVDLDAACTLVEALLAAADPPAVADAVGQIVRTKPYLFRQPGPVARAMSAHADDPPTDREAAQRAAQSGSRRDLLRYLRLRRTK